MDLHVMVQMVVVTTNVHKPVMLLRQTDTDRKELYHMILYSITESSHAVRVLQTRDFGASFRCYNANKLPNIFIKIVLKVHMKLSFSENNDLLNGMGFTDIY